MNSDEKLQWQFSIQQKETEDFPADAVENGVFLSDLAISKIQEHFEALLYKEVGRFFDTKPIFPDLSKLAHYRNVVLWCPIVGMMGGFRIVFTQYGVNPIIEISNWSRMGGGTDWVITKEGVQSEKIWF